MKNYIKDHFFQLITLIPVIFISLGSFILNIYLYQFGIIDIALFDARTIFIGFMAFSIFMAYFLFWFSLIDITGKPKQILLFLINEIWKAAIFAFIIYTYLVQEKEPLDLSKTIIHIFDTGAFNVFATLPVLYLFKKDFDFFSSQDKASKCFLIFYSISIAISTISIIGLSFFVISLRKILMSFIFFGGMCISLSLSIWNRKHKESLNEKWEVASFFNRNGKVGFLDISQALLFFLIIGMMCLFSYSKNIFPLLPCNLGGGYYKYNTIVLEDDSIITGKIIHSNAEYIYVIEEKGKLSQYSINKIKSYEITKAKTITEKLNDEKEWEMIENEQLPEILIDNSIQ